METHVNESNQKEKPVSFWPFLISCGVRAIGAVVNEFIAQSKNDDELCAIGPISIKGKGDHRIGKNEADYSVMVYFTSTDNTAAVTANEVPFKPGEEINIGEFLDANLTGVASWSRFDNNGKFQKENDGDVDPGRAMISIERVGQERVISMFDRDFRIVFDGIKNKFYFSSQDKYQYKDIHIMVVSLDGSVYDFDPFDMLGARKELPFPPEMDRLNPIPRLTIWATCSEKRYQTMVK